mgnify:CR=1 FL=1
MNLVKMEDTNEQTANREKFTAVERIYRLIKILCSYLQLELNIRLSSPRNAIYDLEK